MQCNRDQTLRWSIYNGVAAWTNLTSKYNRALNNKPLSMRNEFKSSTKYRFYTLLRVLIVSAPHTECSHQQKNKQIKWVYVFSLLLHWRNTGTCVKFQKTVSVFLVLAKQLRIIYVLLTLRWAFWKAPWAFLMQKAGLYSHDEMIHEAFPVIGPLEKIVDLTLESGPSRYLPVLPWGVPGGFAPFRGAL